MRESAIILTLEQAADLYQAGEVPWILRLDHAAMCQARRHGRSRKECRNSARWRYVADPQYLGDKSGNYCWAHLLSHAAGSMESLNRLGLYLEDEAYVQDDLFGGWYSP